jgi:hypothetical protein
MSNKLLTHITAWSLALALAFFPAIAAVHAFSPQIKATILDYSKSASGPPIRRPTTRP